MPGWSYMLRYDGHEVPLSEGDHVLGRSRASAFRVDEETVSRSHALLSVRPGRVTLRDLGSANGTFVNGQAVEGEATLRSGDVLRLGSASLSITIVSPQQEELKTEMIDARQALAGSGRAHAISALPAPRPVSDVTIRDVLAEASRGIAEDRFVFPTMGDGGPAGRTREPRTAVDLPLPSPEEFRAAPALSRILSGLVDAAISAVIAAICFLPAMVAILTRQALREQGAPNPVYWILVLFCASVAVAAVSVYFLSGWCGRGATAGQRLLGLRTSDEGGGLLTSGRALVRLLGLLATLLTGGLLFLMAVIDADRRGFADRISGSRVTRAPRA
jgi:uncharacterized RDD family membrane protein YckC